MPKAARQPLILVSDRYDARAWGEREHGESKFESWAAVAQDLWGTGCFAPGQAGAFARAANAVTIRRQHVVGAIGGSLGGLAPIAAERDATIDSFDCDRAVVRHHRELVHPAGRGGVVFHSWNPERPALEAGRFDSFVTFRAFAHVRTPEALGRALADAVKPGGLLFVDELYAADLLVATLVAHTVAPADEKRFLHGYPAVMQSLEAGGLELRSTATTTDQVVAAIKAGLARAEQVAEFLTTIPEPFRIQRLSALHDEMQRAVGLAQALDRGLASTIRTLHRKPLGG